MNSFIFHQDVILKEGFMTKQGAFVKNWKSRWWILYENRLVYYRDEKVLKTKMLFQTFFEILFDLLFLFFSFLFFFLKSTSPLGTIPLKQILSIKKTNQIKNNFAYSFELKLQKRVFTFVVATDFEVNEWVNLIQAQIAKLYEVRIS
jgi:hypothetical protein